MAILIVTAGVLLFSYPVLASAVNDYFAFREVSEYTADVEAMDQSELDRQIALAQAYNQDLPLSFPADPFSGNNLQDFEGTEFEDFELVQPGAMIGYLEIPDIHVYQSMYYGTSEEVLSKGLGLVENTSLPVGGPGTHAVISGHTGMASRALFTDLDKLEIGQVFFVHVLNQHFAYEVDQIVVVLPHETEELMIQKDQDLVTLVTCTPFGINDHRLLVRGHRIDWDFSVQEKGLGSLAGPNWTLWISILSVGAIIILLMIAKVWRDRRKDAAAKAEVDSAADPEALEASAKTDDSQEQNPQEAAAASEEPPNEEVLEETADSEQSEELEATEGGETDDCDHDQDA
ncbi:class C sortase [Slackia heliotrinireducens]|uniref:Sortase family protein, LPXTG-site transpeptidase n=1 Tax=Slackia heliotrinireducens (strain ATCC 29202 / DSM 20476 / NCTC 11029 / RHS 1) TaxID=471855 RepID=C7N1Z8_SLAHD|nr:class C sortase [Slackia heliotrinireducens]ACV23439.1 sortase family protein, LPXTG-site transpeptidase [Slackia heliotrinireducens DSM 20476]